MITLPSCIRSLSFKSIAVWRVASWVSASKPLFGSLSLKTHTNTSFRRVSVRHGAKAFMAVLYRKYSVSGLDIAVLVSECENKVSLLASIGTNRCEISGLNVLRLYTIKL